MKNNISAICAEKGVKISDLIKATGLARSHIYNIIKGKNIPSIKIARIISDALGTALEEVFPED